MSEWVGHIGMFLLGMVYMFKIWKDDNHYQEYYEKLWFWQILWRKFRK